MRSVYLISLAAILASPAMAQSLLEPSSSAAQMQPGNPNSINHNVGAMVALRNLSSVSDALSTQQKRPGSDSRAGNAVDDGAAYSVVQSLRGDMASLNATNSGASQGKQPNDLASRQQRAAEVEQVLSQLLAAAQTLREQAEQHQQQQQQQQRRDNTPPPIDRTAGVDPDSPGRILTRAELVSTIVREFGNQPNGKTPVGSDGQSFTDLRPSSDWGTGYVNLGKSPNARGDSNPPPIDPTAGVDPGQQQGRVSSQTGGVSLIDQIRDGMAELNETNQRIQQEAAGKLTREQQMQQLQQQQLATLPSVLQDLVRNGLFTVEEALAFFQGVQDEQSIERLPTQKTPVLRDILDSFAQMAEVLKRGSDNSGPGQNMVTYVSAMLQEGLTETGTEFASAQRTETAANPWADFAYYSAGQVTPVAPTHALNGTAEGVYNGRVLGAFGNGDVVNGTMTMNITFASGEMDGGITFAGGNGSIGLLGSVSGTGITGNVDLGNNTAFGGTVSGGLTGQMFGPRAEEVGGNWNLSVAGGSRNGQSASGAFAAKQ